METELDRMTDDGGPTFVPGEQPPVLPKAPEYSRKQIGEMRRRFMTVVHDTVSACGHKFRKDAQPKNNCPDCWYAYFKLSVNMAEIHQQLSIPKFGVMVVTREYGAKFVKMFRRFLEVELENLRNAPMAPATSDPDMNANLGTVETMSPEAKKAFEESVAKNPELLPFMAQGQEIIADAKGALNGIPEETGKTEGTEVSN